MTKKKILSLTEARKHIFDIADTAQKEHTVYILTEHGQPKVTLMSAEEFESWEKTIELVEAGLKPQSIRYDETRTTSFRTLEELLVEQGFVVADSAKEKYVAKRTTKPPRTK